MNRLVTVTRKDEKYLENEDVTYVYPIKDFCVGYEYYFDLSSVNGYALVNRILTDSDIDKLSEELHNSHIKGILFEDLGLIEELKDMDIEKILILDHALNNSVSINYYLDYVDSVVVSSDITEEEIRVIAKNAKKKIVIYAFGLKSLMYSRRNLVHNYEEFYGYQKSDVIDSNIFDKHFKAVESSYGTKIYAYPYYNALSLLDLENVLYFWYDPIFLSEDKIISLLNNDVSLIPNSRIFLDNKSIYKVGDIDA